jgi:hypothetical protein
MTECTGMEAAGRGGRIGFSRLGRRRVEAGFDGGAITSDAGGLLLREADRALGLTRRLAACLTDPRDPARITHDLETMLRQRVFAIALGYEDLNDHATLRGDPLMQLLAERAGTLASAPTLCRWENAVDRASMWRLAEVLVEAFIASFQAPPGELVLDFDATDDLVHGKQEERFFHGYYDGYCFLPLYVFCGDRLLCAYLRPSNIDASKHTRAILKLLVQRLRETWPGVRITLRADSGFCRYKMLRWCENNDVSYIVGIARNKRLERMARPFTDLAGTLFRQEQTKQRLFGEVRYGASTWDRQRRVIVKAEHLPGKPEGKANTRFVVTNLPGDPRALYDGVYCARGDMENRIKEQQLGLFADRTSCHRFTANQFRVLLSAAAYVLVEHLRRVGLAGTELAKAQVTRIRLDLFKIGASIVVSARRVVLHLASGYPHAAVLAAAAARLMAGHPMAPT